MKKEVVKTKVLQIMKKVIDREIRKNSDTHSPICGFFSISQNDPIKISIYQKVMGHWIIKRKERKRNANRGQSTRQVRLSLIDKAVNFWKGKPVQIKNDW